MYSRMIPAQLSPFPFRPLRVLVEDPAVAAVDAPPPAPGIEITTCAGPRDEMEECPLVMDGRCPLGEFDVVVTALTGAWRRSVRAAWELQGTAIVDGSDVPITDPVRRLDHHIGSALLRLAEAADGPRPAG